MDKDELSEGEEVTKRFESISEKEIKMMTAITRDPNPIHYDHRMVESMGLPGLINQGASNLSYFIQAIDGFTESPRNISDIEVRFRNQVYEGDSLESTITVDKVRTTDETVVGELSGDVEKEDGTVVLNGTATIEIHE